MVSGDTTWVPEAERDGSVSTPRARRICVFTGSRADYGPLWALVQRLHEDPEIELRMLVSGAHLVPEHGFTVERIAADGIETDDRVEMVLANDSPTAVTKSLGVGIIGFADALERLNPDVLVVFGDRYEALGVTAVALLRLLPVAHIAGGQVTRGALDDSIRHAITKMAHLHFTATPEFRRRIIQLGERPEDVHVVGALGLDSALNCSLLDRSGLEKELGFELRRPLFLVTYHPVTADPSQSNLGLQNLLQSLGHFADGTVIVTGPNADAGGREIARELERHVVRTPRRSVHHEPSLGRLRYLSLLRHADVVIGNSSSGLVEAPALHTPTVNIGSRQEGRPRATSVIDCTEDTDAITAAIQLALSTEFQRRAEEAVSPYGDGRAAVRIRETLKQVPLDGLMPKQFRDLSQAPTSPSPLTCHAAESGRAD